MLPRVALLFTRRTKWWMCSILSFVFVLIAQQCSLAVGSSDNEPEVCTKTGANREDDDDTGKEESTCSSVTSDGAAVLDNGCRIVMARSPVAEETAGWGVFALREVNRGQPIAPGDAVVQVPDLLGSARTADPGLALLLYDYLWEAEETGGFYEGIQKVVSFLPGMGMLTNGINVNSHRNALMAAPQYDEGGLTRTNSPGAGAITYYHNNTFYAQRTIAAGDEILIHYGDNWFQERLAKRYRLHQGVATPFHQPTRSVEWLRANGLCLDNLYGGRSTLDHAGRGAFATRDLMQPGMVVAPVPVLPLRRESLQIARQRHDDAGTALQTHQLLLNYCFGHEKSSLLLYPYGFMVK
jgi:hypothetical protein